MQKKEPARKKALLVKVLVAVFGSALVCFVLLGAPLWGVCLFLSLVAGLSAFELTKATGFVRQNYLIALSVLQAAGVVWAFAYELPASGWMFWMFGALALAFLPAVFSPRAATAQEGAAAVFASFAVPAVLSLFLVLCRLPDGRHTMLAPLVAAWSADSLALLGGMAFSRHKLNPRVSPNKTWEGFFCGVAGGALGMVIYALILRACGRPVSLWLFAALGAAGGMLGALGDLTFSAVKRSAGIKDFGTLMPEHGGALDRFDSVLFVLPLCAAVFPHVV